MNAIKIFPSLISSNVINIEKTLVELGPACDGFHIDIMDNHFVPNLTWGPSIVNQIAQYTNKPLSVHIMAEHPERLIEQLKLKHKSVISFHVEAVQSDEIIDLITEKDLVPGIAIKPTTNIETLFPYLSKIDQVLLMSVEPGFSGQTFLPETWDRLKKLVEYKKQHSLTFEIAIDGGINQTNIHKLVQEGCTTFCIASAIFDAKDPVEAIKNLHDYALEN
jgi:ribulose-phosphate 3-epimerase